MRRRAIESGPGTPWTKDRQKPELELRLKGLHIQYLARKLAFLARKASKTTKPPEV